MEIADLRIMENDNFMKKLLKSPTSGKYWGNTRQQQKKYYGNRMRPLNSPSHRTERTMSDGFPLARNHPNNPVLGFQQYPWLL